VVTARLGEVTDNRAPIEHVKGMLMLICDINDNVAFELLKWLSQQNNIKFRSLAEQLSTDLRGAAARGIISKRVFDHALSTAHEHITNAAFLQPVTAQ
jgi:hypothetical protein